MRFKAWLVLIATLLLWSGNWIVARAVRNDITPGIATMGRLFIVLLILLPFAWNGLRAKLASFSSRDWKTLAALGFTGGGLHLGLQWLGLHYTTATSGILYLSMTPIFILVLAAPLGERIGVRQWAGVAISLCGVYLIATQGRPAVPSFNIGDMMALASMMIWAGYTVLLRPDAQPPGITAWMGILVEGNRTREVVSRLLGEPGVSALHDTNGRWDLLAELRAGSVQELSQVLERIRLLQGIRGTETSIHLATYRQSAPPAG
jgi:drug/metabolite transporter (DMT)-like permease